MMKKLYSIALACMLVMTACKKENNTTTNNNNNNNNNTPPNPKACFTITDNKTLVDSGERISFINCSQNADHYIWNLGGGNPVGDVDVKDTFLQKRRVTNIDLTAFNKDGSNSNTVTQYVTVGFHYLTGFTINNIADTSKHSMIIRFGQNDTLEQYSTDTLKGITSWAGKKLKIMDMNNAPTSIKLASNKNSSWVFHVYYINLAGNLQSWVTFSKDPNDPTFVQRLYPSRGTNGTYKVAKNTNYDVDLNYELRK